MDAIQILAEGAEHASESGVMDPIVYAIGTFVILMSLLGITYMFRGMSGKEQDK